MGSHHPLALPRSSVLLALAIGACAPASLQRDVLRHDLGRGTRGDIELVIPELLVRAGYTVALRRDTGALLYYETAWHVRKPFEDEADQCTLECRSRIIVEARRQGGEIYSVSLRAENSALVRPSIANPTDDAMWTSLLPAPQFRDHVSELSAAIALRIDAGVRVFRLDPSSGPSQKSCEYRGCRTRCIRNGCPAARARRYDEEEQRSLQRTQRRTNATGFLRRATNVVTLLRRCTAALLLGLLLLPWYRLVAARGSGPSVEQTLRLGALYHANLWIGFALTLGAALLLSRMLRPGSLDGAWRRTERALLTPSTSAYGAALAALAFFTSLWVAAGVLDKKPALLDGVAQLVQARYIAAGALSGPPLDAPQFWQFQFMVPTERGWVSQYPPGFAVALALGERLGAAWLAGPLLLAVALFLVALISERLFPEDRGVARIGAALAALSPLLAFHAAAYMSHVLALALAAAAVYASLRAVEGAWRWSLVAGGALGALFATRPFTAVVFGGLVVVVWLAAPELRQDPRGRAERRSGGALTWTPRLVGMAAAAAPFVAGVLFYNQRFFGSPLRFGYDAAEGPGHRLGFHVDPWGNPYGPAEAVGYTSADLQGLGVELLQTPLPAALLVALYLAGARSVRFGVALAGAWALLPVAAHALYWHHDLFMGPRLLYESVPGWCFLVAAAAVAMIRALPPGGRRFLRVGLITREGLAGTLALSLLVGALYAAPRKLASYRSEAARSGMTLAAPPVGRPSLVFVHGSWEDRVAARLDAAGMRIDSIRAALANNPTCSVELYLRRLEGSESSPPASSPPSQGPAPDGPRLVFDRGSAVALRELTMPSGSVIRTYEGEALDPICEREAASDFAGIVGLPPLLWQGDLPGLGDLGPMFVRDLGPERNGWLSQRYPQREPLVLARRGETLRLLPYVEGMTELWSGPASSSTAGP